MKSLKETLTQKAEADARAARERAERETATGAAIAEGFDKAAAAAGYEGALPGMVLAHPLYGSVGSVNWSDTSFDDALAIMRAFPAVPAGLYRDRATVAFRPTASLQFPLKEGHSFEETPDPYAMRLSGGLGYGQQAELDWTADLAGTLVRFSVKLKGPYDVMPRISYQTNDWQGQAISIKRGTERVQFPLEGSSMTLAVRYRAGSETELGPCLFVGTDVVRYVEGAVAHLDAHNRETRAAYERAKAAASVELPTREEIDALAETLRDVYNREKFRPDTLRQYAALRTPAAEADRELAKKHWPRYAEEHGLESRGYFDHYGWACGWLQRVGLLTDEHNGQPYRYGTAWLDEAPGEAPGPRP